MALTKDDLRKRLAAERKELADRYFAGDPDVEGGFFVERKSGHVASGNRVGELQFGKRQYSGREAAQFAGGPADEVARFDHRTGEWVPEE